MSYLQAAYQTLQQHFANPKWLAMIPPVLAAITILYFLKLKRRELVISSTFLWRQAVQDLRVNSPFQRLRMNLLLFLQLLIATLILIALARPRASVGVAGARDHVLLIDRSASMGAVEKGETRLSRALDQARRVVADMTGDDRALIIAFDSKPAILETLTNSRRRLLSTLKAIEVSDKGTRLAEALELAFKVSQGQSRDREREVHLFSDGVARELGRVLTAEEVDNGAVAEKEGKLTTKIPENTTLRYVKIGEPAENLGISGLSLRRTLDREGALQLFMGLVNTGIESEKVGIDISLDGQLIESREVNLPGRVTTSLVIDSEDLTAGKLEVSIDREDPLAIDNKAYAIAEPKQRVLVLMVTDGNPFLEKALETMPFVRVETMAPGFYSEDDPSLATYDAILFDRFAPKTLPASGCLFVDAHPKLEGVSFTGEAKFPRVVDYNRTHPVAVYVDFDNLEPVAMRVMTLRKKDQVVVEAEDGPLIAEVRGPSRNHLVLAFDVLKSRWPFQAGFPIFLANAIRWLAGASASGRPLIPGQPMLIPVDGRDGTVKITNPKGETKDLPIEAGRRIVSYSGTDRQGFYRAEVIRDGQVEKSFSFAVNLSDAMESALSPQPEIKVGGLDKAVKGEDTAKQSNRELWKLFAWALLAFLIIEWWVYNRRVYV